MRKISLFSVFATLLALAPAAHASIFDAADYLSPGQQSAGLFGEALLSDPTSQGVEGRYRLGLQDDLNVGAMLGTGSDNRKFRLGAEAVYSLIPDIDRQIGVDGLASAMIIRRADYTSLQFRVAPMVSKLMGGIDGYPANVYFAIPLYLEVHSGGTDTGSQMVLGVQWDITDSHDWYMVTEGGAKLAHSESYVLLGFGLRFGTGGNPFHQKKHRSSKSSSSDDSRDRDFQSEDFQK